MNEKDQAEHDHAVEVFVDGTLRSCVSILHIIEGDMRMVDTQIPAEDEDLWVVIASRVYLGWKLFQGYGASLILNEHVRKVLMAEGRSEVNEDISVRLDKVLDWIKTRRKQNPALNKMIVQMGDASDAAFARYTRQQG